MLKLKMTDNGLMAIDKDGSLCRIVSEKSDNQILNNARSYLDRLNSDFMESVAKAKALSIPDSFDKSARDYAIQGDLILKAEYDRLFKSITHYPVSHNRFYNPKKSKKQKQKEKIDRLEKELKEAREVICSLSKEAKEACKVICSQREVICSQSVEIHRLKHQEATLIENQPTTVKDVPEAASMYFPANLKDDGEREFYRIIKISNKPLNIVNCIKKLCGQKGSGWEAVNGQTAVFKFQKNDGFDDGEFSITLTYDAVRKARDRLNLRLKTDK